MTRKMPGLLLILTLFTVTFFVYRDFDIRMLYGFALLGVFLLAAFVLRILDAQPLQPHSIRGAFLFLAAVLTVSFLRPDSQHSADTLSWTLSMLLCTGFVWLHRGDDTKWPLTVLLTAAGAMTAFVLLSRLFPETVHALLYPRLSPVAQHYLDYFLPFGYGMALGGYTFTDYVIFAGIAVCWGKLASAEKRSWSDLLWLALIFLFGFAILTLGRRGELLMAVVLCAGMVLLLCGWKMRIALILGGTAAILGGLWIFIRFLPQFKEIDFLYRYVRTIENLVNGYDFTSGRTGLFQLAIEGFRSAPLFGIGFDQFHTLVNPLLTDIEGNVMQDTHNIYLQMLCETGITGAVLVFTPMLWLLITTFRTLQAARRQREKKGVEALTVSLLLQSYLLLLGLLDPTFQKIVFWCFYGLSAMLLLSGIRQSGCQPGGPLTRLFHRLSGLLTAALGPIFRRQRR